MKIIELLEQSGFDKAEIADFISNVLVIKCPKKKILLREGDTEKFIYWAISGVFRAGYIQKDGTEITRAFFTAEYNPIVASYSSFINQTPSNSFIDTLEEGELWAWHYDYYKKLEATNFKWLNFFKRQGDSVITQLNIKEFRFYTLTSEELYSEFMATAPDFIYRIPQHYIATYLGMTPEALSRIKKRLHNNNKKE